MSDKGTALIVTMIYLIIVAIICTVVLSFSSGHYRLMSHRVEKFQKMYYAESGLYLGLAGATGTKYIISGQVDTKVDINTGVSGTTSKGSYNLD